MEYYLYAWEAQVDFTDINGQFHLKNSIVYIGSGSGDRFNDTYYNMAIRSSRSKVFHEAVKQGFIVSKILYYISQESKIKEEQLYYDYLISIGYGNSAKKKKNKAVGIYGLSLFNATRPNDIKTYNFDYLSKFFELSTESPSGLIWKEHTPPHKTREIGTNVGTLNSSGYWVVNLKAEIFHCHKIVNYLKLIESDSN